MDAASQWKPLIAVLANPGTRRAAAQVMLGADLDAATEGLSPSRRRRAKSALVECGLASAVTGELSAGIFRSLLDSSSIAKSHGLDRFREGNRIRQYPANRRERGQLLAWVAHAAFKAGEVMCEREVNSRLRPHSDDVATLRRYLVDYELLERSRDGTEYALTNTELPGHAG